MRKEIFNMIIVSCALVFTFSSAGAETVFINDPIVITASRYETSVSKEGKDISVVTEEDIKKSGKKNLADVLETVVGVTIVRSGTEGSLTKVYIRGSKSGNVMIMIDGVKVYDPTALGNVYDISGIMTSNIERIEIVKGAMSSMYGAEASGGVINIITKKGEGKKITIAGESGSDKTFSESFSFSDSTEKSSFFLAGSHYITAGISNAKRSHSLEKFDNDSYENITASGKMSSKITDKASVDFTMNYTDSKTDIDDGSFEDDTSRIYTNKLFTSAGDFKHSPLSWWTYKVGVSYMSFSREDVDTADSIDTFESNAFTYDGSNSKIYFLSIFNILDFNVLTLGTELLNEKGRNTSAYSFSPSIFEERNIGTKSFFLHDAVSVFDMLYLNAGARIDNHEVFGSHFSWDASAAFIITQTGTKLKTSAGTGFRAPTLSELYGQYGGNDDLKPETSFIYDTGIYQELFNGILSADFTFFRQQYEDTITWHSTGAFSGCYDNSDGNVKNRGFEAVATFKPAQILKVLYGYTYIKYDNNDSQTALKRPVHTHSASVTVTPFEGLDFTGSFLYVHERKDVYFAPPSYDTETIVKLDSYCKFDMNIRYAFNETITFTARGENLTNTKYMETYGYNTKSRSFYGGAEIVL